MEKDLPTKLITIKQFASQNPWPSESAIRAYRAGAPDNGFASAFVSVGRRVLVDSERFWEIVRNKGEGRNAK